MKKEKTTPTVTGYTFKIMVHAEITDAVALDQSLIACMSIIFIGLSRQNDAKLLAKISINMDGLIAQDT